jgi:predicted AAA+ superfamily ATPase
MIDRSIRRRIEDQLDYFPAVVLLGPRQVGKTTLARAIGEQRDAVYLDLEDGDDRQQLYDANRFFDATKNRLVILDEVHRTPELFQTLRGVIDRGRREGLESGRFLILGSASGDLLRQSGESLAGRVSYIDMSPLTVREVTAIEQEQRQLWSRGGYPTSFLAPSDNASFETRISLIRTYLDRDIPMFGPRLPVETIRRFWVMLAHRQGGILNASDFARSLDTTPNAVSRYIDLLVDLFLVRRLPPYSANLGKRLVKSPKVYVRDSGLVHALLGIRSPVDLLAHPVVGASWEGFVIENLIEPLPWPASAYFYRTQAGAEIDLVIEHPDLTTWVVEVKRSIAVPLSKGFWTARETLQPARSFVVHSGDSRFPMADGVEAIGVTELATMLAAGER